MLFRSPQPLSIKAAFTSSITCGLATFTDATAIPNGAGTVKDWLWSFPGGNPSTSTSQNPGTITYNVSGTYSVTLVTISSNGCRDSVVFPITAAPAVTNTVTGTSVPCAGSGVGTASVVAAGGTPGYTYAWSNGQATALITGLNAGTYTVLITDSKGCTSTGSQTITSGAPPVANFSSIPVCVGLVTQLAENSSTVAGDPIQTYSWSLPGGNPSSSLLQNPTITYPAGNYTAMLTITSVGGCTSTITKPIVVNPLPQANFVSVPVCFNAKPTSFKDMSIGNSQVQTWKWDFGDGNTSGVQHPTHTYGSAGTFTVTLLVTNTNGCTDKIQFPAVVNPNPVPNFSSVPVCKGDSTCFTDHSLITPGKVVAWNWNFGDPSSGASNTSTLQNPCHTFTTGLAPYSVILTVTSDSGCQGTTTLPATINPPPVALIKPVNVCLGHPTQFSDGSTALSASDPISTWIWTLGDGSTSTLTNPIHTYSAVGTYSITLNIATKSGCKAKTTSVVDVYPPPTANFSDSVKGCAPQDYKFKDLSLSNGGQIATWQWSFPGGSPSFSTLPSPTVHWSAPGVYDAQLIVTTNYKCADTMRQPMYIHIYPWPSANFCVAPTSQPVTDPVFKFCDQWSKDVSKWSWDFGDNTSEANTNNPSHSYSITADNNDFYHYNICIRVETNYGCWDTACHPVELLPEFEFYIPNTFTPNGDRNNEVFYGKSRGVKEYNIWVFDRWGNQLWDCHYQGRNTDFDNDRSNPRGEGMSSVCRWDGKVVSGGMDMSGNSRDLSQEDVYVWKVRLTDIFNKKHFYIGHVSVVK